MNPYQIDAYAYNLPTKNIAQKPAAKRDASRLLALDSKTGRIDDLRFRDILNFLKPNDLLVVNDTRVFPARLLGNKETGGRVELMLLEYPQIISAPTAALETQKKFDWQTASVTALLKSSKRPKPGGRLFFSPDIEAIIEEILPNGKVKAQLRFKGDIDNALSITGNMPLPPYISRNSGELSWDKERYQTVFARQTGAVAAPTAGLHFTDDLLAEIKKKKVGMTAITLHVGYGTFAPVRVHDIRTHQIHAEYVTVSKNSARLINETIASGGTVWAVGTTTARTLEYVADKNGRVREMEGWCELYIYPGYQFKVVKNLITNFHLPGSSLLFMVSALAGRERILKCYQKAVELDYKFYSYGDAMVIMT